MKVLKVEADRIKGLLDEERAIKETIKNLTSKADSLDKEGNLDEAAWYAEEALNEQDRLLRIQSALKMLGIERWSNGKRIN